MLQRIVNAFRFPIHREVYPRYCRDCKFSKINASNTLKCTNPLVNGTNAHSLSSIDSPNWSYVDCWVERSNKDGLCSIIGFLWESQSRK